ncbi:MAG: HlyD family type I secretion periplasmic adaptor subunit [Hyphomicrobiales bacterium]
MKLFRDPIHQDDNLAMPLEIDGGHWDGTFRRFLWALSGFVVILITMSVFAPVREVAIAEGEIIPVGSIVSVEHLEGGIVDNVYVGEGGFIRKGELLMKLHPESGSGDFNQVRVRRDLLDMRRIRLGALLKGLSEPDFGELAKKYPTESDDQLLLFTSEQKAVSAGGKVLESRLEQRHSDLKSRKDEIKAVDSQIAIYQEQYGAQKKLNEKGFSSRSRLLQAKARVEEVRVTRQQLLGTIESIKGQIVELTNETVQAKNTKKQEWSDALVSTIGEISELDERLKGGEDRVKRLAVYAPKTGRVQSLAAKLPGQVIRAGDVVAEIVPLDASVEAEVRIQPKDIGYVRAGHPAEITLSTFDPEVFGKVHGEVRSVSPTTFETDRGDKYFKGLVTLDRSVLEHNGRNFPITAGMVVTANVITGSKSVMQYILKPVVRSYDRAFSER